MGVQGENSEMMFHFHGAFKMAFKPVCRSLSPWWLSLGFEISYDNDVV
jgi:hypothetical protein